MKRLALLLSGVVLAACAQGGGSATLPTGGGGRPDLPSVSHVTFPAALGGDHLYLSLQDEDGHTVYQVAVPGSASQVSISPAGWIGKQGSLKLRSASDLLPTDASDVTISNPAAQVAFLTWTVWRDANMSGTLDAGEALPLMTHDVVIYATAAGTLSFNTATPDTHQTWTVTQGWSRGEHYVYRPAGSSTYQRSIESTLDDQFALHEPTPDTSM